MMTRKLSTVGFLSFFLCLWQSALAQVAIHDGSGTPPDASSMLDVQATGQGMLAPRMTQAQRPASPATGLLIYQTDGTEGFYYYDGSSWVRLFSGSGAPVTGSGAATRLAFWNGANSLASSADLYWDNTNKRLGIGTSSPTAGITINNGNYTLMRLENDDAGEESGIRFRTRSPGDSHYFHADVAAVSTANAADVGYLGFKVPFNNAAGSGYRMIINSQGNIGIGTTAPNALLHLQSGNPILHVDNTSIGASSLTQDMPGIVLSSGGMNSSSKYTAALKFGSTDPQLTSHSPKFLAGVVGRATQAYTTNAAGGMALDFLTSPNNPGASTAPEVAMTISQNGDVGIGTESPTAMLDVDGKIRGEVQMNTAGEGSSTPTTTATNYTAENSLTCSINVQNGDVVMVQLDGQFWNPSANSGLIAYANLSSGSATSIGNTPYIMTNANAYAHFSGSSTRYYRATANGTLTFNMMWRTYPSGGTAYARYRNISAVVIGKW